jgi:hypothetical protein
MRYSVHADKKSKTSNNILNIDWFDSKEDHKTTKITYNIQDVNVFCFCDRQWVYKIHINQLKRIDDQYEYND